MKLATVAIIGRPNVGKSTLFNRIVGSRRAIVEPTPGVTRDRNYAPASWQGRSFQLIDTGGWEMNSTDPLQEQIRRAAERAVSEADLVIFLLDGKEGMNPIDPEIYNFLRGSGRPTLVAVNKIDGQKSRENLPEFYSLGAPEIFPVSAEHGTTVAELLDAMIGRLPAPEPEGEPGPEEGSELRVAIVGRPNVGKSTLVNRIVGDTRVIVDDRPGTTRDPIDVKTRIHLEGQDLDLLLIDLAGIRRRSRVSDPIEHYSVTHSLKAIRRADVALLILDAGESIEVVENKVIVKLLAQEARLADFVYERGRGLILVVNKWDLVRRKNIQEPIRIIGGVQDRDHWLDLADVVMISALQGEGIDKLLGYLCRYREVLKKIPTSTLNHIIQRAIERHHPPAFRGKEIRVLYATQVKILPQVFVIFTNHPQGITDDYQRYLANVIREELGLKGIPIRLKFRKKT